MKLKAVLKVRHPKLYTVFVNLRNMKRSYRNAKLLEDYATKCNWLLAHSDITKLKPATGFLRRRQLELLEFARKFFDAVSVLHIEPFLVAGSLLGAIRHRGYIPWDDDLDFGLFRDDYEKLRNYCQDNFVVVEMESDSVVVDFHFKHQIYEKYPNRYVLLIYHNQIQICYGTNLFCELYIDFFPFDIFNDDYSFSEFNELNNETIGKIHEMNMHDACSYIEKQTNALSNYLDNNGKNVFWGLGTCIYETHKDKNSHWIDRSDILPLSGIIFEGYSFLAPAKPEKYMEYEYKNFMCFPPDMFAHHMSHPLFLQEINRSYIKIDIYATCIDDINLFKNFYFYARTKNAYTRYILSSDLGHKSEIKKLLEDYMVEFEEDCDLAADYVFLSKPQMMPYKMKTKKVLYTKNPSGKRGYMFISKNDFTNMDESPVIQSVLAKKELLAK